MLKTVFDRFSSNSKGGKRSGAGLGLSIVESFVTLHKGEVKIDSRAGAGTTVTCRIPAGTLLQSFAAAE
jgi:signal transduction histidine kinase